MAERSAHITGWRKILIWVGVSLLYVAMFAPALFTLAETDGLPGGAGLGVQIFGLLVMAGGLGLETLADKQKSDFKAVSPSRFCDAGAYRYVRCPNYLGEILFWVGTWLVGIPVYHTWLHWAISLVGVVCVVLIMLGSTKRLEEKQDERYGGKSRLPDVYSHGSRADSVCASLHPQKYPRLSGVSDAQESCRTADRMATRKNASPSSAGTSPIWPGG